MVWIPGGEFSMGAQDPHDMHDAVGMQATTDSRPVHRVYVDGFWMEATEVTNEQFALFVKATGYVTPRMTPGISSPTGNGSSRSAIRRSGLPTGNAFGPGSATATM
jgi:formylglycine-generating enzyme required for sulfatase activity